MRERSEYSANLHLQEGAQRPAGSTIKRRERQPYVTPNSWLWRAVLVAAIAVGLVLEFLK